METKTLAINSDGFTLNNMLTDPLTSTNFLLDPSLLQMYARSMGMLNKMATSNVTKATGASSFRISDILSSPEEASGSNSESEARASSEECRSSPLRGSPSLHDDSLRGSSPSDKSPGGKKARKARTIFTDKQLQELENTFDKQKYLSVQDRMDLAQRMGLSDTQVKTWYQNRRTKWKRQSSSGIELLADPSNIAAVQQLLQTNPYWANYMAVPQSNIQYPMNLNVPGNSLLASFAMPPYAMPAYIPQNSTPKLDTLASINETL